MLMTPDYFDNFMYVVYVIIFLLGSLFGSFFNVCIYRIPRIHFTLTVQDIEALEHDRPSHSLLTRYLIAPLLNMLQFLGIHPGWHHDPVPPEIQEQLAPMAEQDYITLNDFADALESHLGEEYAQQYGDAILQHTTRNPESIVFPGSHCPECQAPIDPWDNIPIISFLLLKGKCRTCGTKISWRYPLIEFLTAALYVGLIMQFGLKPTAFAYIVFASLLLVISCIDLDHKLIPDILSVPGIILGILAIPFLPIDWQDSLLGILVGASIIWLTGFLGALVFKKEAMGGGDIKLMAMIGAFLGWKMVFLTIFFGSVAGALIGIVFKLLTGKDYIPFGPFLSIGALLALYIGPQVLFWYWGYWDQVFFP